jgi:nucleotidyltransferase substrate binding protein (TIGR01987 family)
MIDYEKLKKSLRHLEKQFENYSTMSDRNTLSELDKEGISESVVQRFEVCYDTLWKHLKKYLEQEAGLPDVPNSPKPVFRLAHQNGLISDIEAWIGYANTRVETSHDYSELKLQSALGKTASFIRDAILVYEKLTSEKWSKV